MADTTNVVGLLPAAGRASRLGRLPCSKEIFPISSEVRVGETEPRPRAVCEHVLQSLRIAGIRRTYVVLRDGKWDIPAYLGDGESFGMDLAYLVVRSSPDVPTTLDHAYPFIEDQLVALGFPDTLFEPPDAFTRILEHREHTNADLVLGLFPMDRPDKADMVVLDRYGRVRDIVIKDADSKLSHMWGVALWTPAFTRFMHAFLESRGARPALATQDPELYFGDVIRASLDARLEVESVRFDEGWYRDVGTPEDLARTLRAPSTPRD